MFNFIKRLLKGYEPKKEVYFGPAWDLAKVVDKPKDLKINVIHDKMVLDLIDIAKSYGYERYLFQPKTFMISFFRGTTRINVYYTRMTVATVVNHPKQGRNQLFRRNVTMKEFEKILDNPRTHTSKGYR